MATDLAALGLAIVHVSGVNAKNAADVDAMFTIYFGKRFVWAKNATAIVVDRLHAEEAARDMTHAVDFANEAIARRAELRGK